jgi:hypothetical protein
VTRDALNVTISEDGDGTEGVIKNVKGTIAGSAVSGSELTDDDAVTVIGQVSDSQRGYIYFFVADDSGSTEHAIYQYNTSTNTYRKVFKKSVLGFNKDRFIKADVLNINTNQGVDTETILYFTDGATYPKRINVDRAIAGDFDNYSNADLQFMLSACKAAPKYAPTFVVDTDSNIESNNLYGSVFQFATQYIYKDGEESAISPYSKAAYPDSFSIQGVEDVSPGLAYKTYNRCKVNIYWGSNNYNISEVDKVRLLARNHNDGSFFVIDEFDPNVSKTRDVWGTSTTVYDSALGEYKFYNDVVNQYVSNTLVNKLYDNVPLTASGQAIAGNRLFYSDYTEGRENVDVNATISVNYQDLRYDAVNTDYSTSNVITESNAATNGDVLIDLTVSGGFALPTTTVPSNTTTTISFEYNPDGTATRSGGTHTVEATDDNGDSFEIVLGNSNNSQNIPIGAGGVNMKLIFSYTNDEEITVATLTTRIKELFLNEVRSKTVSSTSVATTVQNSTSSIFPNGAGPLCDIESIIYYDFGELSTVDSTSFIIKPYISTWSFLDVSATSGDEFVFGNYTFNPSDEQSDIFYTINNGYLSNALFVSSSLQTTRTFKAGSSHDLGVVYYDEYNRSGFVNKIGSFYVHPFGDPNRTISSTAYNGSASASVSFTSQPPDWAKTFQLVYGGMSTFSDFFSYTVGNAYPERVTAYGSNAGVTQAIKTSSKKIYVSLNTLQAYRSDKGALLDYSFTEGDVLRVISYTTQAGALQYPRAVIDDNTSETDYGPIEFNVVGVEFLENVSSKTESLGGTTEIIFNPIHSVTTHHTDPDPNDEHAGMFLVLEAPIIVSGTTSSQVKYPNFDWYSVVGEATGSAVTYPNGDSAGTANHWGRGTTVEILTPKKEAPSDVYYEIGNTYRVLTTQELKNPSDNKHGYLPITTSEGDAHFKPVACKSPSYSGSPLAWTSDVPEDWVYRTVEIESRSVSDFFPSKDWSKGRPHAVYERAATFKRKNGVTYSDPYAEDVAELSLSSFNPSVGNFDSLDAKYGAIDFIGNYNDDLVALQENKLCLIPVNKNILEYASGSADVAVSTNVLGQRRYSAGDYGTGGHPEAVLIQDNSVYFVDESRQAVCSLTGGQLVPISDKSMSSFFEDFFATGATKYVSGYDPRDNTYYITRRGTNEDTVGYDAARGVWQSRYDFTPDLYSNQNNMLYSAKYDSPQGDDLIFWRHDDDVNRNRFYGAGKPSKVQVVSKMFPSRVKVFNAISYEGDSPSWFMSPGMETDLDQLSGTITSWQEREGSYYSSMPRNTDTSNIGARTEEIYIGTLTLVSGSTYSSNVRLNRLSIPTGASVTNIKVNGVAQTVSSYTSNQITFNSVLTGGLSDVKLVITHDLKNEVDDPMRGHWAKITLTNSASSKHELYCINTHITDSKSHHPLGQ